MSLVRLVGLVCLVKWLWPGRHQAKHQDACADQARPPSQADDE